MMLRRVFGLCCLWTATTAAAEPARLSSEALSATVPGATIALDTPIGTKIPMRFGTDGLVSGEAGVLGSFLGAAKDRGRWWVANDRLCIKWFRWFESEPRCMEISAEGPRITWRQEDGDTGTATLSERALYDNRRVPYVELIPRDVARAGAPAIHVPGPR